MRSRIPFSLAIAAFSVATTACAEEPAPQPMTGTITGRVLYEPDAARAWRYQRYYVKQLQSGELAEAVVALRGRGLKQVSSAKPAASHVIDQFSYQFVPETTAIRAGETVTFTNSDATTHNVRSAAGIATFNITMGAEDEFQHRFDRAGGMRSPVLLGCVYHGGMRAWIYVFDHPFFAITGADGRFTFEEVPPGRYTLEMAHPAGGLRWKQIVEVKPNETLTVDIRVSPDHKTLR